MERPHCRICNARHYSQEPHVWASKDFVVLAAPAAPVESSAVVAQGKERPPSKRGVRGSNPRGGSTIGPVAQLGEHPPCKRDVAGSIPAGSTTTPVAQPVERRPLETDVEGPNPSGRAVEPGDKVLLTNQTILPNGVYVAGDSTATPKSQRERKSRYRTPEATEAYRAYKRAQMAKRRAVKE